MPHTAIADLEANQFIEGIYVVQNCQLGMSKGGKPYVKCLIADRTGRTPARLWNADEIRFKQLPTNGFVEIEGTTQPYQGEIQIILQEIREAKPTNEQIEELLPKTKYDIEKMFAGLVKALETIEHPALALLARCYLEDEALIEKFKRAPAAMTLHHAYIGGLLEHTLSLMRLGHVVCPLYPGVNREIVMLGLFLHDLGKCVELTWDAGFGYSDEGMLVGHIARGVIWLEEKAKECEAKGTKVPEPLLRVLHHIILSHHGKAEFGALKVPATPEALAISLMDNLDAKMHMALVATRDDEGEAINRDGNFTERIWALDTRMYRPDPTKLGDDD